MRVIRSARHAAKRDMRRARRAGSRAGAAKAPWPSTIGRFKRRGLDVLGSPAGLLLGTATLTALMLWSTYWVRAGAGRSLASNGFLTTLWQVQAAAVSLALALAVFVFGLFPRSGKRVSYRAFLRRTSARPVIAWGISSLLLDGIVLLGFGHQVPNTPGTSDGHGWAVTVACAVGLVSIASIALLFGRTIGAIDPVAGKTALSVDRNVVIGEALREDLLSQFAYDALEEPAKRLGYEFVPSYRDGERVYSPPSDRVVRDVSRRRLAAIGRAAQRGSRALPQVHAWPGQRLAASSPMVTFDPATPWADRLRARHCVRLSRARRDESTELLDALHADVLDHIRADRPIDARDGLATVTDMLRLAWQADLAHTRSPQAVSLARLVIFTTRGFKDQIIRRLTTVVRAGAVSSDEQIRNQTARLPRDLAALALQAHAAESVRACLTLYPRIYEAVISEVTGGGQIAIPASGIGRRRIAEVFESALSFTNADLHEALSRTRKTRSTQRAVGAASFDTDAAVFVIEQAPAANTVILAMLRQALAFGDVLTLQRVVPNWAPQDADWLSHELQSPTTGDAGEAALAALTQALNEERRALAGMKLRLLRSALGLEAQRASDATLAAEALGSALTGPDPAVATVLDSLEAETFWAGLSAAVDQADQDLFPPARDNEVRPDGWHMSGFKSQDPGLAETFVRAALARPHLVVGGEADPDYAQDHAITFIEAARKLAIHLPWAKRYGVAGDAESLSSDLISRMQKAAARARRRAAQQSLGLTLPEPQTLREVVASQYTAQEVVIRLLAWAARPPLIQIPFTGNALAFGQFYERRDLADADPGSLKHATMQMANGLAHGSIGELIATVSTRTTIRNVPSERIGERVRLAIAALRRARCGVPGLDASAAGIVVFVPNQLATADLLAVTDRARDRQRTGPGNGPSPRERMLTRLGFDAPQLQWCLLGLIDDVPVVRTTTTKTVVVLDLAYGVECRTNAGPGTQQANLVNITLTTESEESARKRSSPGPLRVNPPADEALDDTAEDRITTLMTRVFVEMELAVSFTAAPNVGVRILAITGP